MPMCDIHLPVGALEPAAEAELVRTVSDLLVHHELRRITDLMSDPSQVQVSVERASSISRMFVHRAEAYVAGERADAPQYKFEVTIPEGTIDEQFPPAITRDIYAALKHAEGGAYPHLSQRVWVFIREVPDGFWGAGDRPLRLADIIDFVAPGMGQEATGRFERKKREDAVALTALARETE